MSAPPPYDPPPGHGGPPYGPPPEGEPPRYGPPPNQGGPQHGGPGPYQGGPQQGPPPQYPVPGGAQGGRYGPPPEKESRNGCAMAGGFAGGLAIYFVLNLVIAMLSFSVGDMTSEEIGFGGAAVVLALLALGGGGLCFFKGSQVVKAIGMGLIFGWSAVSVISLGYCTGLNPSMYGGSF